LLISPSVRIAAILNRLATGETVRRGKSAGLKPMQRRPETGSLNPMAIEIGCFLVTKSTVF